MICAICKTKLKILTAFPCDCCGTYCNKHRLREDHDCPNIIRKITPQAKIVADKITNRL